jgi:hypothetical protein
MFFEFVDLWMTLHGVSLPVTAGDLCTTVPLENIFPILGLVGSHNWKTQE